MKSYIKRVALAPVALAVILLILMFPGLPWSASCHHTFSRIVTSIEMKMARLRGVEPRLVAICGRSSAAGAQIQVLDSKSGWAVITDSEGKFTVPGLIWYPGTTYKIVITTDDYKGKLIKLSGPSEFPQGGMINVGELDSYKTKEVMLSTLPSINSMTLLEYDSVNRQYYREIYDRLTTGKLTDEEKINAIYRHVSSKAGTGEVPRDRVSARMVLEHGAGFCGDLALAMATLVETGNYPTRMIDTSDGSEKPNTHVLVEVFYDRRWHLYDPTYGVTFQTKDGCLASYKELRLDARLVSDNLYSKLSDRERKRWVFIQQKILNTGYHHLYRITRAEES
jgi:hypothetical protein